MLPTTRSETRSLDPNRLDRGLLTSDIVAWGVFRLSVNEPQDTKKPRIFLFQMSEPIIPISNQVEVKVESTMPTEDPVVRRIKELQKSYSSLREVAKANDTSSLREFHEQSLKAAEENINYYTTRIGKEPYIELGARSLVFLVKEGEHFHFHPEWSVYYGEPAESLGTHVITRLAELNKLEQPKLDALRATYRHQYEQQRIENDRWRKVIQDEKQRLRDEKARGK